MLLGFNLYSDGTGTTPYYTEPFPRQGLVALFSILVTHVSGTATLVTSIESKNRNATGWAFAGSIPPATVAGVYSVETVAVDEGVRFAFTFSPAGATKDFFRVYIPPPAWRPYE